MIRLATLLFACTPLLAADPPKLTVKVGDADPPTELQAAIRKLLESKSVVVSDNSSMIGSFWIRKEWPVTASKDPLTYRSLTPGMLVGALKLERPWSDFRGNEAPAGIYTLRITVQPESKDHEGTAPYRDFCILVPAAEDTKPDNLPLKALVAKSGKATGGTHPLAMLLVPNPKPDVGPMLITKGKRLAIGVRVTEDFGFGFTVAGTWTD